MVGRIKERLNGNTDLVKVVLSVIAITISVGTLYAKIDATHEEAIAAMRVQASAMQSQAAATREQTAALEARVTALERWQGCTNTEISQGEGSVRATLSDHGARIRSLENRAGR